MEIVIKDLTKTYGSKTALNSISLTIKDGIYGLLGKNGAGKTTLMKILVTLLNKTHGQVTIEGCPIEKKKTIRELIGYLPQEFSAYPSLTVYETMDYLALLSDIKKDRKKHIYELLEQVNMEEHAKKKIRSLSGGMKQRLGIAQALINDPKLLIIDEPTAGIDPEERIRVRNLLGMFADKRTVIISTHIVSDLDFFCEKLAVLDEGNIAFQGKALELRSYAEGNVWLVKRTDETMKMLESSGVVYEIMANIVTEQGTMLRILSSKKPCDSADLIEPTLEDGYMKLIKNI